MNSNVSAAAARQGGKVADAGQFPVEHYLRLLLHRKWLILSVWVVVALGTFIVARRLQDVFMSETVILVDPQKVPESYVKSTVTGDIRNRLSTLSQQILSATRLQKVIDSLNLYPEERKSGMAREDVITKMRSDISVHVVSDFGASLDLQAFKITYTGKDARLVAQVTNQLASLFIEANMNARELQATGTTEFLSSQLMETRKTLDEQESKLRDFKLKHVGEMPAQESADLQLLAQAQSQLTMESDAAGRAEQQKSYIQSMMAQSAPVLDVDDNDQNPSKSAEKSARTDTGLVAAKARLAALKSRYTETHPDVQKLSHLIADAEAKDASAAAAVAAANPPASAPAEAPVKRAPRPPANPVNPVLLTQVKALDAEIAKHREEQKRLSQLVSTYRAHLDAIPIREQEITQLERDYQISKNHYSQLLEQQLSAQTATQLEIRQKGEKFEVLDLAQPAERPFKPNRVLINAAGAVGGLFLGLVLAAGKEFLGMTIITHQDIAAVAHFPVLGEIPMIQTRIDRRLRMKRIIVATSALMIVALACGAVLFYHYRIQA